MGSTLMLYGTSSEGYVIIIREVPHLLEVPLRVLHVMRGMQVDKIPIRLGKLPLQAGRRPQVEGVGWNYGILHHQRARRHNRALSDPGVVQHDCADANQAVIFDSTSMKHG